MRHVSVGATFYYYGKACTVLYYVPSGNGPQRVRVSDKYSEREFEVYVSELSPN